MAKTSFTNCQIEAENILQEEFNNDEDDGIGEASTAEMFVCPVLLMYHNKHLMYLWRLVLHLSLLPRDAVHGFQLVQKHNRNVVDLEKIYVHISRTKKTIRNLWFKRASF